MQVTLSPVAATLSLLHAAAHPSSTVNGVFLGTFHADPSSSSSSCTVTDTVPLLHHYTSLSPMMEIGLEMASVYAKERGLEIVGYYQANEVGGGLGRVGERVVQKLKEGRGGVFGVVIDNERILSDAPFQATDVKLSVPPLLLKELVEAGAYRDVGDFDDHLEDVRIDWIGNAKVKDLIEKQ